MNADLLSPALERAFLFWPVRLPSRPPRSCADHRERPPAAACHGQAAAAAPITEVDMPVAKGQAGVRQEMHKFKAGTLHSGSKKGPLVTSRKQAIAISLSEAGLSLSKRNRKHPKY